MEDLKRTRVVVDGRVQGVWFRESTRREASRLGLAGWVRNLPGGRVEAVFEGAGGAVDAAVEWTRRGPERALVTSFDVFAEQPEGLASFEIQPTVFDA